MQTLDSIADFITTWLLRSTWQSAVLIGLVFLVSILLRKQIPAGGRYALWCIVLVRLLVPSTPTSPVSLFNYTQVPTRFHVRPEIPTFVAEAPQRESNIAQDLPEKMTVPPLPRDRKRADPSLKYPAVFVWLCGTALVLLRIVASSRKVARIIRTAQPVLNPRLIQLFEECRLRLAISTKVALCHSDFFTCPTVSGCFRPKLLIPRGMAETFDDDSWRLIFLHELAHIRRKDLLLNWLCAIAQAIHWFNPLVWLAFRRMRAEREIACDALALRVLGERHRTTYGQVIIRLLESLATRTHIPATIGMLESASELRERLRLIARFTAVSRARFLTIPLIATLAAICLTDAKTPETVERSIEPLSTASVGAEPESERDEFQAPREAYEQQQALVAQRHEELENSPARLKLNQESDAFFNRPDLQGEGMRAIARDLVQAKSRLEKEKSLRDNLRSQSRAELRKVIPVVAPDLAMNRCLEDLARVEQQYAAKITDFTPDHPEIEKLVSLRSRIDAQIEDRIDGVLAGLDLQINQLNRLAETLEKRLEAEKIDQASSRDDLRAYSKQKHDLEAEQRELDSIYGRILSQAEGALRPKVRRVVVRVSEDANKLYLNDKPTTLSGLASALSAIPAQKSTNFVVVIAPDKDCPPGEFVKVLDAVRALQLGIEIPARR